MSSTLLAGQLANALKITGLRKVDTDVRQGRLHENCRDITVGELTFQPVQVVELGDPRGGRDIDRLADTFLFIQVMGTCPNR